MPGAEDEADRHGSRPRPFHLTGLAARARARAVITFFAAGAGVAFSPFTAGQSHMAD